MWETRILIIASLAGTCECSVAEFVKKSAESFRVNEGHIELTAEERSALALDPPTLHVA